MIYGSGQVMYNGKDGVPEPSVRIDTVRDALEDYEYLRMIESIAAARPAGSSSLGDPELSTWSPNLENARFGDCGAFGEAVFQ